MNELMKYSLLHKHIHLEEEIFISKLYIHSYLKKIVNNQNFPNQSSYHIFLYLYATILYTNKVFCILMLP